MTSDAVTDLFAALHANNREGVRLLVGAEPELLHARSPSGLSPVLFAAYYHRPDILRDLIAAGAPLTVFEAAAAGETARVLALLDPAPDALHTPSPDGFTPLALAAQFGHADLVAALLTRGADVNAASHNAMQARPLHLAVAGRHTAVVRQLLDAGADANARQSGDWTALHSAAQQGDPELLRALLAAGADPQARTDDGRRAADLLDDLSPDIREETIKALVDAAAQR